ncbi:MAG: GIY-YIG nuclease family protein [Betaproteobacteria bacterium]
MLKGGGWDPVQTNFTLKQPCVYMLASQKNGTLYVGVTSDLVKRVWQHKCDLVEGFTKEHQVHTLVWYEVHGTMESAIVREKNIKAWKRLWKLKLIEESNPDWTDLYDQIV